MGRFSQKGFCYSFEILQGLLSNKKIRIPTKIKFWGPPPTRPPKKAKMGRFSQKGLCYSFEILQELLSNKIIRILMREEKKFGAPPSPPKKPILGGQKPKWAISPKRVCATVLKFCRGSPTAPINREIW